MRFRPFVFHLFRINNNTPNHKQSTFKMSLQSLTTRPLFGGAIAMDVPADYLDAR